MKLSKTAYIILIVFLVALVTAAYIACQWAKAFSDKCETRHNIFIKEYKIVKSRCIGWAGPPWDRYELYKNRKKVSASFFYTEFGTVYFVQGNDKLLTFDTTQKEFSVQFAQKKEMRIEEIDSIVVIKKDSLGRKKLNKEETTDFANRWNTAKPDGAERIDIERYIKPVYTIKVYGNAGVRRFMATQMSVQETTSIWVYSFLEDREERTTNKLDQVFKMN